MDLKLFDEIKSLMQTNKHDKIHRNWRDEISFNLAPGNHINSEYIYFDL